MTRKAFIIRALAPALLFALPLPLAAATVYYVDFDHGDDSAAGTAPGAAFQRAPGDPEATNRAASVRLDAGDRVVFKGGIAYRGRIVVTESGESGSPIVFDGNSAGTFGTGPAILDGGEIVPGLRPCRSAEDCGGNPNWERLYTATVDVPEGTTAYSVALVQEDRMLFPSQYPKPDDPFYDCDATHFHSTDARPTFTELQDDRLAPIGDHLVGAYVVQITVNNFAAYSRITDWDAETQTITYERANRQPIGRYSIANSLHGHVLSRPGEYVFDEQPDAQGRHRITLWPWADRNPNDAGISATVRHRAFDLGDSGVDHIGIEGFRIQNYGQAIRGSNTSGVRVRNNEITRIRTTDSTSAVRFTHVEDHVVEGNHIHHCQRSNAIQTVHGEDVIYRANTIRMVGRSPLRFYYVKRGQMIDNIVLDCRGIHSNPFTIYVECEDVLVARNVAHRSNIGLTLNTTERVYIINNIFTAGGGSTIGLWPGDATRDHVFLNNYIGVSDASFFVNDPDAAGLVIKNNILAGKAGYPLDDSNRRSHNIYLAPRAEYAEGEFRVAAADALFVDPRAYDFRPVPTGPAVDRGTDVSEYYPRGIFPDFDFDADFAGNPRVHGGSIDIGPYEAAYEPGALDERPAVAKGTAAQPPRPIEAMQPVPGVEPIVVRAADFSAEGGGEIDVATFDDEIGERFLRHWTDTGHWIEWLIADADPGTYKVTLRYATLAYAPRSVSVNGEPVAALREVVLPRSGGWRAFVEAELPAPVTLDSGDNTLRLTCLGGIGLNLEEIRLIRVE